MEWITENWLLILLGGGMLAMHLFGHKHGGKGKSGEGKPGGGGCCGGNSKLREKLPPETAETPEK